jgi:hypothetical protein
VGVLTVAGVAALVGALVWPWVYVRHSSAGLLEYALGLPDTTITRTLPLAGVPGLALRVFLGWGFLLILLVVGLLARSWRRRALGTGLITAGALVFMTFDAGPSSASLFKYDSVAQATLLRGAWLAQLGVMLILAAIAVVAFGPRLRPRRSEAFPAPDPPVGERAMVVVDPLARSGPRWWRRDVIVNGMAVGVLAVVTAGSVLAHSAAHPASHDHTGDLHQIMIAAPVGTPAQPADTSLALMPAGLAGDASVQNLALALLADGFVQSAVGGWTDTSTGQVVRVGMFQFDNDGKAEQARDGLIEALWRAAPNDVIANVPGVPGADAFTDASQPAPRAWSVAQRGNIVFMLAERQQPASTGASIEQLTRDQYQRL